MQQVNKVPRVVRLCSSLVAFVAESGSQSHQKYWKYGVRETNQTFYTNVNIQRRGESWHQRRSRNVSQNECSREHTRVGRTIQIVSARPHKWILDTELTETFVEAQNSEKWELSTWHFFFPMILLIRRAMMRKMGWCPKAPLRLSHLNVAPNTEMASPLLPSKSHAKLGYW